MARAKLPLFDRILEREAERCEKKNDDDAKKGTVGCMAKKIEMSLQKSKIKTTRNSTTNNLLLPPPPGPTASSDQPLDDAVRALTRRWGRQS